MVELTRTTGSQRKALGIAGIARSTWQYRRNPRARVLEPVAQKDRAYLSRIPTVDRAVIAKKITAGWAGGHSVDHTFASTWDRGVMLAARRSWWRIAADIEDQSARPVVPTGRGSRTPREKPVLIATGPGQVWSWDITDLRSPWRGKAFKAYSIIDIYSRKIVGWRVEERESDHLAVAMFQAAFRQHGTPRFVHADSGPAMRSGALAELLEKHDVTKTHNRPYVSNDNPFSESEFRTMKYRPNYPGTFETLEDARGHLAEYVPWYNATHRHSGIALFTPQQVHDGSWRRAHGIRDHALQHYHQQHPERFRERPTTPAPASLVGINHLADETATN
ncbi:MULTISPECIES: DDE-type integrase/transposase/recombinase [Cryobacterium]|uniref:Transposase n=1 Tax=Cryobacterium breve TaxID=1259258 RepID=A0ABY2J0G6_9MICO|nr:MULTISPECIES: DDE-type integrase/transposase/recombinase [Cryobacterium]TFC93246.1 transposase [Cryobacterium sp. TmT3-12]TFC96495.1 transposase [Cryobacterium breve]